MTNKPNQSRFAAAALALAAAFATMADGAVAATSAIPEVAATFGQARVIHVKGRQYFPGQRQENGQPLPPVEIDTWIDKQTGRTRDTRASTSQGAQMISGRGPTTSTTVTATETICDGTYEMTLNHTAKTASFARVGAYYRDLAAYRLPQTVWGQLSGQAPPESFSKAGRETVDGSPCDVWQSQTTHTLGDGSGVMPGASIVTRGGGRGPRGAFRGLPSYSARSKLWLTTDNGRLVRAQVLTRMQEGPWELQRDYQTIECNGAVPPEVFTTEPPAGYTAKNAKAAAPNARWRQGMRLKANGRTIECGVLVAFALNDGSIIAGWHSRETQKAGAQEALFAHLTFGGPLPKLPVEIYGLQPAGRPAGATHFGHHLTWTRKGDRFTEWSLYVPTGTAPIIRPAGYNVLYRLNIASATNAMFGLTVDSAVPIKTAEDFDKWVGGALTEFSDKGKAPEPLTYQRVIELAQRLRTPAKP